ncbi:hypothetical protein ACHQM5_026866 [Ranunculus cassubicifolius]
MAKKKSSSNQEKSTVSQNQQKSMEAATTPTSTEENQSEMVNNLKSLNNLLLKETLERRGQIDSLMKSKHDLEIEIEKLKKQGFEDLSIEAEIRKSVTMDFVNEQIELEKERLKEEMCREKDELRGLVEEKNREIESVGRDFGRFREEIGKEIELKRNEVDLLRSRVVDLEKSSVEAGKEIERIRLEKDEVVRVKSELEKRIEDLNREMKDVVKQKGEIQVQNGEKDRKIQKLQKSLDGVNDELDSVKGILAGVVSEKEGIRKNLDGRVEEAEKLKVQVGELEKCNVATEQELCILRSERRKVMDERKEIEGKLEVVLKEKEFAEGKSLESSKLIANLKGEIKNLSIVKVEGEQERAELSTKIVGSTRELEELQTNVSTLQGKEADLLGKVTVLGKSNAEALRKQEKLQLELNKLKEEKSDIEKKIEVLVAENSSTLRNLQDNVLLLEAEKRKVNEIIQEKSDIEKVKNDQLTEIDDLSEQVNTLKALVSSLEESCQKQADANNAIQSVATQYKDALENVTVERDNIKEEIELKKKEEERLGLEVLESDKRNRVTKEELESVKIVQLKLSEEIKVMKSCIDTLTGEKGELERKLVKAEEGFSELEEKMKSSQMHSVKALEMLRNTMKQLEEAGTDTNEELTINGDFIAEELQPFVAELEAIRKSFKGKTGKVEEMYKRYETLQVSVSDAQKKRNFWAWLSSATTLLAAVSMAYIARGR